MTYTFPSRAFVFGFGALALAFGLGLLAPQRSYAATYTIDLLTPASETSFHAGDLTKITWNRGEGDASFVNLAYSEDGGSTWVEIARNTPNDGLYVWEVSHIQSNTVWMRVTSTDLAVELASDVSGPFTVTFYAEDNSDYWSNDGSTSHVTPSAIDGILAGDFLRTEGVLLPYSIGDDMARHPFYDEETYYTYEDTIDAAIDVSLNTFHKFNLGDVMLPQAGVVLIKTPSVSKVYIAEAVEGATPTLHWITSEDIAKEMFGEDWNSYVFDVDSTLFVRYSIGDALTEAYDVDTSTMKRVADLHE